MPKIRSIHFDAWKSNKLAACSDGAERLFWRLQPHCDDAGRCEDDPVTIWGTTAVKVAGWDGDVVGGHLAELAAVGLVDRYEIEGRSFLQVVGWETYQHPRYAKASLIPPVPNLPGSPVFAQNRSETVQEPPRGVVAGDQISPSAHAQSLDTESRRFAQVRAEPGQRDGVGEGVGDGEGEPPPPADTNSRGNEPGGGRIDRVDAALDQLAALELGRANCDDPGAYRAGIRRRLQRERAAEAHLIAHQHPDWTPAEIAEELDEANRPNPAPSFDVLAMVEKDRSCESCHGTGWVIPEDEFGDAVGEAERCVVCSPEAGAVVSSAVEQATRQWLDDVETAAPDAADRLRAGRVEAGLSRPSTPAT